MSPTSISSSSSEIASLKLWRLVHCDIRMVKTIPSKRVHLEANSARSCQCGTTWSFPLPSEKSVEQIPFHPGHSRIMGCHKNLRVLKCGSCVLMKTYIENRNIRRSFQSRAEGKNLPLPFLLLTSNTTISHFNQHTRRRNGRNPKHAHHSSGQHINTVQRVIDTKVYTQTHAARAKSNHNQNRPWLQDHHLSLI